MKHMASGTIAFIGVLALAGCYSYTGEAINNSNYNTVQATPNFLVVKVGDSSQVIARLVNDNNNGAITSYTVGGVGAGVAVHYQAGYRPIYDPLTDSLKNTTDKTAQQYFVVGTAVGRYTFTLTPTLVNTGISSTVTAVVIPANLGAALSKTSAAAGDTIVVTAPTGTVFSQTSAISFDAGSPPAIIARSADSTTITFLAAPGDLGFLTVTKVGVIAVPSFTPFSLATTNKFAPAVPSPTVAPSTVSNLTPSIGVPITVQLGGNLRFLSTSHVFIGAQEAGITAISADSSTATIVPMAFSNGLVNYTSIALSFLNTVPLTLNGDKTVTIGAAYGGPVDANANTFATATTYVAGVNGTFVLSDGGAIVTPCAGIGGAGSTCRFYKVTVTAGTVSGQIFWTAAQTADLGVYTLNAAGTGAGAEIADEGGPALGSTGDVGPGTHPTLTAGTVGFVVIQFPPNTGVPTWFQFRIAKP